MELLTGKEISLEIKKQLKEEIEKFSLNLSLFVLVNENDKSSIGYVNMLEKSANEIGIKLEKLFLPDCEQDYIDTIERLNKLEECNAIMVTRPLFKGADENKILSHISSLKDVDVMNNKGLGKILIGDDNIAPATSMAIIKMLEYYNIPIASSDCLVIGRSISVGKPVSLMLLNRNASVTIAHSKTKNLEEKVKNSDIIICAVGKPHFLDGSICKENAVVIDAGIHYLLDGTIVGDVIPNQKIAKLSKVPGGVGSITTSILLENVLKLYYLQKRG